MTNYEQGYCDILEKLGMVVEAEGLEVTKLGPLGAAIKATYDKATGKPGVSVSQRTAENLRRQWGGGKRLVKKLPRKSLRQK